MNVYNMNYTHLNIHFYPSYSVHYIYWNMHKYRVLEKSTGRCAISKDA